MHDYSVEGLLKVDQRALARAIDPVLERGKHDGVFGFCIIALPYPREYQPITLD